MGLVVLAAAVSLSGCAVERTLVPTGGSRSDGTVELSYSFGSFEQPKIDYAQGVDAARQRCQAWGYTDAEPFGGQKNMCQASNAYGCIETLVTIQYQCIGANKPQ